MDCRLPGSSAHGIFQARVLEWGAIAFYDSYLENPINRMKRQKDRTLKDELPMSVGRAVQEYVDLRHLGSG